MKTNKMKKIVDWFNVDLGFAFKGTNESIAKWCESNLDKFDLNEEHSCDVTLIDNIILIGGDEDSKEFTIEEILPIIL
tara:strand:+ start:439 stop:672 length:234 start_codon:yes stop_codon:yes gene_type:complete